MRLLGSALAVLLVVVTLAAGNGQLSRSQAASEDAYRANNAGVAALERYDYKTAAALFRDALRLDPSVAFAHLNLAIALHYDGDPEAASKEAMVAAKAMPREPRAWFVAGLAARAAGNDVEALTAFEQVVKLDPSDVATLINIGQVHLETGRYAEAIDSLAKAAAAEPFNATAAYGHATALLRARRTAEGQAAMARFQVLRDAPYAVTYAAGYLQQGRYAEAIVSTGAEPQLVETGIPAIRFRDVTAEALPGARPGDAASITLSDVDADGDVDLLVSGAPGPRLFRRDGASWKPAPTPASTGPVTGTIAADYDNDGRADVLVLRSGSVSLWRQVTSGAFEDVTVKASLEKAAGGRTAAWADLDHDGDVDFIAAGDGAAEAWRNNGNGTFVRFPPSTGLDGSVGAATSVVPTDFDAGRDVDVMLAGSKGVALLRNMREGRFENVASRSGFREEAYQSLALADLNADGRPDFFLGRAGAPGLLLASDGAASFKTTEAPVATSGARAAQFVDYDSDGVLDLVTLGAGGFRVLRNIGNAWIDVSAATGLPNSPCDVGCALASADVDDDGDVDLLAANAGKVRVWRNDGPPARALTVRLKARVSNRSAVGSRIDMRAGSLLRRFETSSATPSAGQADLVFGLGRRSADVVRVIWPSGIVQAENTPSSPAGRQRLDIGELDRKPSSCPYLFTWNGERFEFVSDFLGGGEMGLWLAPGVRSVPDPEEFVRIRGDQLKARNGRYELRVTNELEEALFVDRLSLIAVTHRVGTEVHPNEGLFAPPYPRHRLFVTRGAQPPERVTDEHGHDVRDLVSRVDRRAPSDFALERFRGYAQDHHLDVTIPRRDRARLLLLLTAWTDYAFSSDNVAASQAGLSLRPPSLEIEDNGKWRTVIEDIGIPVGRPQTVVVDLTGRVPLAGARLRVRTNMRIYWDQVLVDTSSGGEVQRTRIEARTADLRWRGYSTEVSPDGLEPFGYDYGRVLSDAPWKLMPGRYTREGDVRALIGAVDDLLVVSRPGDALSLSFPALPPVAEGWTRTFLLHADGYSKEMDANSASPDVASPLPYHGMRQYPYDEGTRAVPKAVRDYVRRYNTRVVSRTVPVLAAPMAVGQR